VSVPHKFYIGDEVFAVELESCQSEIINSKIVSVAFSNEKGYRLIRDAQRVFVKYFLDGVDTPIPERSIFTTFDAAEIHRRSLPDYNVERDAI
jgi:hypothetical protein